MDNIEQLSNDSPGSHGLRPDILAFLRNARIPKHRKGVPARGRHPFDILASKRRAARRQYFSMMSGEAMYTMIWSVPSAIWFPRQSCHSWLTRAPSV